MVTPRSSPVAAAPSAISTVTMRFVVGEAVFRPGFKRQRPFPFSVGRLSPVSRTPSSRQSRTVKPKLVRTALLTATRSL